MMSTRPLQFTAIGNITLNQRPVVHQTHLASVVKDLHHGQAIYTNPKFDIYSVKNRKLSRRQMMGGAESYTSNTIGKNS